MDESSILGLIAEIEGNAQRREDRGLEHGTTMDIVQAQMALGCKRGMAELRTRIRNQVETEKRIRAEIDAKAERRAQRKRASAAQGNLHAMTPTGTDT